MYKKTIHIALFGCSSRILDLFKSAETPENLAFKFAVFPKFEEEAFCECDVAAIDANAWKEACGESLSLAKDLCALAEKRREQLGKRECFVIAIAPDDLANGWSDNDYKYVDFAFSESCSDPRIKAEIGRAIQKVADSTEIHMLDSSIETLMDTVPDLVWFKDNFGIHHRVNQTFCDTVHKTKEQVRGRDHFYIWDVEPEEYYDGDYVCVQSEDEVIAAGKLCVFDELVQTDKGLRQFKTYKSPIFDEDGEIVGTIGLGHDITHEEMLREQALENARTDYLTGLYNRRHFYEYIAENHDKGPIAIAIFDLDDFKHLNDTYGHNEGDKILIKMAELLREEFDDGLVTRWGGDEFVVALIGDSEARALNERAGKLLERLDVLTAESNLVHHVTGSAGVSIEGDHGLKIDELIRQGDEALYDAKGLGKSRCCVYEESCQRPWAPKS